jgi:hypothetical protein
VTFARDFVLRDSRALFFWAPKELFKEAKGLRNSMRGALGSRLSALAKSKKRQVRPAFY